MGLSRTQGRLTILTPTSMSSSTSGGKGSCDGMSIHVFFFMNKYMGTILGTVKQRGGIRLHTVLGTLVCARSNASLSSFKHSKIV